MGSWSTTSATNILPKNNMIVDDINFGKTIIESKHSIPIIHYLLNSSIIKVYSYKHITYEFSSGNHIGGIIVGDFAKGFKSYINFFEYAKGVWPTEIYNKFKLTIPIILKKRAKYTILDPSDVIWMGDENATKDTKIIANDIKTGFTNKTPEFIFNNQKDTVWEYSKKVTWKSLLNDKKHNYIDIINNELDGMLI